MSEDGTGNWNVGCQKGEGGLSHLCYTPKHRERSSHPSTRGSTHSVRPWWIYYKIREVVRVRSVRSNKHAMINWRSINSPMAGSFLGPCYWSQLVIVQLQDSPRSQTTVLDAAPQCIKMGTAIDHDCLSGTCSRIGRPQRYLKWRPFPLQSASQVFLITLFHSPDEYLQRTI